MGNKEAAVDQWDLRIHVTIHLYAEAMQCTCFNER